MDDDKYINEFMGLQFDSHVKAWYKKVIKDGWNQTQFFYPKYQSSWDDLMPVVEKISRIRCAPFSDEDHSTFHPRTFGMLTPEGKAMVRIHSMPLCDADTLIEATYQSVVEFIKLYVNTP